MRFSLAASLLAAACLGECHSTKHPKPPKLVHLLSVVATELPAIDIGDGGSGHRLFIPVTGGNFTGPKLSGKVLNAGGDWGHVSTSDGKTFSPDAKIVVQTDDGANILISGRGHSPLASFEFETGSEKYKWLNTAIGVGTVDVGEDIIYVEIFQVRENTEVEHLGL